MRSSSGVAFSARAGLMWPPVSLEHEGADWHVRDFITPSAINSWIGEEVKPLAAEGTFGASLGQHKLRATAALIAANDTAGTLLTFRGWALHDRTTLAFRSQPLPPLGTFTEIQAPETHPLNDVHRGFAGIPAITPSSRGNRRSRSGLSCSTTTTGRTRKISPRSSCPNGAGALASTTWGWSRTSAPVPSSRRKRSRAGLGWAFRCPSVAGSTSDSAPAT